MHPLNWRPSQWVGVSRGADKYPLFACLMHLLTSDHMCAWCTSHIKALFNLLLTLRSQAIAVTDRISLTYGCCSTLHDGVLFTALNTVKQPGGRAFASVHARIALEDLAMDLMVLLP